MHEGHKVCPAEESTRLVLRVVVRPQLGAADHAAEAGLMPPEGTAEAHSLGRVDALPAQSARLTTAAQARLEAAEHRLRRWLG